MFFPPRIDLHTASACCILHLHDACCMVDRPPPEKLGPNVGNVANVTLPTFAPGPAPNHTQCWSPTALETGTGSQYWKYCKWNTANIRPRRPMCSCRPLFRKLGLLGGPQLRELGLLGRSRVCFSLRETTEIVYFRQNGSAAAAIAAYDATYGPQRRLSPLAARSGGYRCLWLAAATATPRAGFAVETSPSEKQKGQTDSTAYQARPDPLSLVLNQIQQTHQIIPGNIDILIHILITLIGQKKESSALRQQIRINPDFGFVSDAGALLVELHCGLGGIKFLLWLCSQRCVSRQQSERTIIKNLSPYVLGTMASSISS